MNPNIENLTRQAVVFHGHCCPGLTIGILACAQALEQLSRAKDEEVVSIIENNSCMADAVQALTGCTFGKGNLLFRDWGKMAVSFYLRQSQQAFRIAFWGSRPEEISKEDYIDHLHKHPEFFHMEKVPYEEILQAEIHPSTLCSHCQEPTMSTRLVENLCIPCAEEKISEQSN